MLNITTFLWLSIIKYNQQLFPHGRYSDLFSFFFGISGEQHRILNNNNNDNNNNSDNFPETRKYWVDVQRGIVSSHGERDPL